MELFYPITTPATQRALLAKLSLKILTDINSVKTVQLLELSLARMQLHVYLLVLHLKSLLCHLPSASSQLISPQSVQVTLFPLIT
jgi:hypothetical protein